MKRLILILLLGAGLWARAWEISVTPGPLTLTGRVTYAEPGSSHFYFRTDDGAWWRCGEKPDDHDIHVGDRITLAGRILPQTVNNRIDHCEIKKLGHDDVPRTYEHVTVAQLNAHPVSGSSEPDRFARLVEVDGTVLDVNRRMDGMQLILTDGGHYVSVSYRLPSETPLPEGLAMGARVRVKGVYIYMTEPQTRIQEFTAISRPLVMLDSPDNLTVLTRPPFWTTTRIWLALGFFSFIVFGLVFWSVSLRRTVSRQVRVIEKALRERAVADGMRRERLRLSHDLHDDFQQLLAGSMFRISAALNWLAEGDAEKVRTQLEKATTNLVHTQSQLRTVLWGLQEESEGPVSLIGLFRYAAGRMAHWEGVVEITSTGREPTVARTVAGGLLMILQESVGNAIRHGHATRVDVSVAFHRDHLTLTVKDNGVGFDTAAHGHGLGLGGMGDRARTLGGTMKLESEIGKGTTIEVEVPV